MTPCHTGMDSQMRFILCLLPPGTFGLFAADRITTNYAGWVEAGAATVVSGLLVYLVTWYLPQMHKAHREDMERQQALYAETLEKMADRFERMSVKDERTD